MINQKLFKKIIIRKKDEFESLFRQGKRHSGRFVYISFLPLDNSKKATVSGQVAFICGRRIGNAVTRNLYKRRMREIFRKYKVLSEGYSVLIIAQASILKSDFDSLEKDIIHVLQEMSKFGDTKGHGEK